MKYNVYLYILLFFTQLTVAQTIKILPELKQKVEKAANELSNPQTSLVDPVSINGTLVWSEDKTQVAVVLKASIKNQWHIYAYVPKDQPFITSELRLKLPKGIKAIGTWNLPYNDAYGKGIYVYRDMPVFIQYCAVEKYNINAELECGLFYQACDPNICFPPQTKMKVLKL
ncbi:protein-disulfide reductase DsbD domain-containing protein [uncultured Croceitalea sp.]|uniref:protein-disulfide reductase DsbD domain-containing protein n=1 Tax=uncultured Croceitalea sp. TaxID=1798908 RepID=UPI00374EFC1B